MGIKKITKKYKNGDMIIEDYDKDGKRIFPEMILFDNIETNLQDLEDSDRFKEIKKYDDNGNLIYRKSSEYEEDFYFYINDILVQKRNHDIVNDTYSIIIYDKNGNQIYKKNHGMKDCCIDLYDYNSNNIFNQSFGNIEWSIYDENNRIKQFICLDDEKDVFVELYDYSGLNSHSIGYSTNGTEFESWTEYDENGNKIRYKDTCDEYESIWKYDENNRVIFHSDEFGNEYFYEYYE